MFIVAENTGSVNIHKYNLVHNFDFICFPYK